LGLIDNRKLDNTVKEETKLKISEGLKKYYSNAENRKNHSIIMTRVANENPESYSVGNLGGRTKIYEINRS
jgi:hypothetical protein